MACFQDSSAASNMQKTDYIFFFDVFDPVFFEVGKHHSWTIGYWTQDAITLIEYDHDYFDVHPRHVKIILFSLPQPIRHITNQNTSIVVERIVQIFS